MIKKIGMMNTSLNIAIIYKMSENLDLDGKLMIVIKITLYKKE